MTDYLMIHPPGHGAWSWDGVKGIIEDSYRSTDHLNHSMYIPGSVLTPDYGVSSGKEASGYGSSSPRVTREAFSKFDLNDWVDMILDDTRKAGISRPVIVGHSLAGLATLEVARRLPDPPKALVLIGAVIPDLFHNVLEMLPFPTRILFAINRLLPGSPEGSLRLHREITLKLLCGDLDYLQASHILGRIRPVALRPLHGLPHPDFLNLRCPITYVVLKRDKFVPPTLQLKMADSIDNARIIELDCGHEAPVANPTQVAEAVLHAVPSGD